MSTAVTLRDFKPGDEAAFRRLNEEWISRFFVLEPKDVDSLANPQQAILDKGGRIFLALLDTEAIGCCALVAMEPGTYEVAKMAVTASAQGSGVGRKLLAHVIDQARAAGATRLYLETNRILIPAIRLYEALGFQHLSPERVVPSPYARADVYMELNLAR